MSNIGQLTTYARFAIGLRRYLHEQATPELGRLMIEARQRDRQNNFLSMVRRAIYDREESPYLPLLRMAGCEYGDLERMVRSDGIEDSLTRLRDAGVYITIDEFKGRQPVVRGRTQFQCRPQDFDNPFLHGSVQASSSGTRGARTQITVNLHRSRHSALSHAVALSAHGVFGKPSVLWLPILPSSAGFGMLLQSSKMRMPPLRWFSPVSTRNVNPAFSKRLAMRYVVYAGRLFGVRMPLPEYVSGGEVHAVAECLLEILQGGSGCVVFCTPSSAVKVCHSVMARGRDLSSVTFVVSGEPLTPARMAELRRAGADAVNLYAFAEGGIVGFGCADAAKPAVDDIHALSGAVGVVQRRRETPFGGGEVGAFLFTTFLDRAAKVLLNVESGDYGVLETRDCSCELGTVGLTTHLHSIRSFDKLTGEGMTFVGTDLVRIIEEVLPARFGGASTDYQMLEYEDGHGGTQLDVLVSPNVGAVDESALVSLLLGELRKGGDTNRMMSEVWRERGIVRVRREQPRVTAGGKLLPLYICREDLSTRSPAA